MASQGHIKIDRRILNWEWYTDSNMVHVFLHLLLNANYSDNKYKGVLVKRGQLITGRSKLATSLGLSQMQIRTCLDKLSSTNEIIISTTNRFSIITICKYDSYQSNNIKDNQQNNQQITNKIQPIGGFLAKNATNEPTNQSTNENYDETVDDIEFDEYKIKSSTNRITNNSSNKQPTDNQQITTSKKNKEYKEEKEYNKEGLIFPFKSLEFKNTWNDWIDYKKSQFNFKYKALKTEQISLDNLFKESLQNEKTAIEMINQSISNGWQGIFKLKAFEMPIVKKAIQPYF